MSKRLRRHVAMLWCSFCGKSRDEVRDMVAGPEVLICSECVADAVRIMAERAAADGLRRVK